MGECVKIAYASKAAAKRARRQVGDRLLRPYRCPACTNEVWHLGHLPQRIIRGHVTREEAYGGSVDV